MSAPEVAEFLSVSECEHLIQMAITQGLKKSETYKDPGNNNKGLNVMDIDQDKQLSVSEVSARSKGCVA